MPPKQRLKSKAKTLLPKFRKRTKHFYPMSPNTHTHTHTHTHKLTLYYTQTSSSFHRREAALLFLSTKPHPWRPCFSQEDFPNAPLQSLAHKPFQQVCGSLTPYQTLCWFWGNKEEWDTFPTLDNSGFNGAGASVRLQTGPVHTEGRERPKKEAAAPGWSVAG